MDNPSDGRTSTNRKPGSKIKLVQTVGTPNVPIMPIKIEPIDSKEMLREQLQLFNVKPDPMKMEMENISFNNSASSGSIPQEQFDFANTVPQHLYHNDQFAANHHLNSNYARRFVSYAPLDNQTRNPPVATNPKMKLEEYRQLHIDQFQKREDLETKKQVFLFIEKHPVLWSIRGKVAPVSDWQQMAIDLYNNTNILLSVKDLQRVFENMKRNFRDRLRPAIRAKNSKKQMEAAIKEWDLYPFVKFYRPMLQEFVAGKWKEFHGEEYVEEDADDEKSEDGFELTDYVEYNEHVHSMVLPKNEKLNEIDYRAYNCDYQATDSLYPSGYSIESIYDRSQFTQAINNLLVEEYRVLDVRQFQTMEDIETRKYVLIFIRSFPELWNKRKVKVHVSQWEKMAVEMYNFTNILLKVDVIVRIWRCVKNSFKQKIRVAINAKISRTQLEAKLNEWELYPFVQFYRPILKEFEIEKIKEVFGKDYDSDIVDDDTAFDDEIEYLDYVPGNPQISVQKIKPDPVDAEHMDSSLQSIFPDLPVSPMTLEQYKELKEHDFVERNDTEVKKWIIALIEKTPILWSKRKPKIFVRAWQDLAIVLYFRTGLKMSTKNIRNNWKCVKQTLQRKLKNSIISNDSEEETDAKLERWELYAGLKFFRQVTEGFEKELRKKVHGEDYDEGLVDDSGAFDDELQVFKVVKGRKKVLPAIIKPDPTEFDYFGFNNNYATPETALDDQANAFPTNQFPSQSVVLNGVGIDSRIPSNTMEHDETVTTGSRPSSSQTISSGNTTRNSQQKTIVRHQLTALVKAESIETTVSTVPSFAPALAVKTVKPKKRTRSECMEHKDTISSSKRAPPSKASTIETAAQDLVSSEVLELTMVSLEAMVRAVGKHRQNDDLSSIFYALLKPMGENNLSCLQSFEPIKQFALETEAAVNQAALHEMRANNTTQSARGRDTYQQKKAKKR